MKKIIGLCSAVAIVAIAILVSCNSGSSKPAGNELSKDSLIKRGEYLVTITGCDDCHSPKKMGPRGPEIDMERRLSGYDMRDTFPSVDTNIIKKGWALTNMQLTGWAGPWGASFTANITSDETGIGNWSYAQFKKAITEGKWKGMDGNRPLMPPMPWQNYKHFTETYLQSIFAFLQSTKPVKNVEPAIKPFSDLN
ncbi:MAG: diheme cytochrome c-553 [Bacteroidetes bacterium]|nr:diheme cytochrome c-553 [Bacteroidota bacterium]